jgi:hypothetical protein
MSDQRIQPFLLALQDKNSKNYFSSISDHEN